MRDFLPKEKILRDYVIDKIRKIFEKHGFDPLETPALELAEVLEGKYGEEEKLIYKFKDKGGRWLALRYDQTVPLARVIAMNPQIPLPFRRYAIGPVWRYDEPQKGRYRQFYQCDIDIVGSKEILADAEILGTAWEVYSELGFKDVYFRINNRKLLDEIFEKLKIKNKLEAMRAIDKLDKIGLEGVKKELAKRGFEEQEINRIMELLGIKGSNKEKIDELKKRFGELEGLKELEELFRYLNLMNVKNYVFDLSLVRGLDYYTGPIYEAWTEEFNRAIGGGGRYDNLIGKMFGKNIPATGFAVGIEAVIDLIKENNLIKTPPTLTKVFVTFMGDWEKTLEIVRILRKNGINTEFELMGRKLNKQLEYANKKEIPFVIIMGEKEWEEGCVLVKDMKNKKQEKVKKEELVEYIINHSKQKFIK